MMTDIRSTQNPPQVSLVIPALNEAKNLPYVLPRIPQWISEVLLVDGHSTDDTADVARKINPAVRIIMQPGRGKGDALRAGFAAAKGDIIVTMDADGSNDPAEILAFVALLRTGADFVKGSRFVQGGGSSDMTFFRKLGNWGLMMVTRLVLGCNFSDLCYGYNAFWASCLPALRPDVDGFEVEACLNIHALAAGLKVAELPSYEDRRIYGDSNLRAVPDGWRILKLIFREVANKELRSQDAPWHFNHAGEKSREEPVPTSSFYETECEEC
jgi:glycosyltransferase involved in cell wall biosynthesis